MSQVIKKSKHRYSSWFLIFLVGVVSISIFVSSLDGSGSSNYIAKFNSPGRVVNSNLVDDLNSTLNLSKICTYNNSLCNSTITNNITNTIASTPLKGISNSTYSAEVKEEENYFNSPWIGWGCYENWLLQSEAFATTWVSINHTAVVSDSALSPIGTMIAENILGNSTSEIRAQTYQTITNLTQDNVTFSIWARTYNNAQENATIHLWLHSNNDTLYPQTPVDITITPYWNRYNITLNYNFPHTIKNVTIINDEINISLWGAQLERGNYATINGAPRTTTANLVKTCGTYQRGNFISSGSGSFVGVAVGGALSGATTGAFSSNVAITGVTTGTGGFVTPSYYSITLNNTVGRTLLVGELVTVNNNSLANNTLMLAPASSNFPIGAVAVQCNNNTLCTIAIGGKATVMLKDTTNCTTGQWVGVSDTVGRAYCINDPVAVGTHNQEIGHSYTTRANATNQTIGIVMHFN